MCAEPETGETEVLDHKSLAESYAHIETSCATEIKGAEDDTSKKEQRPDQKQAEEEYTDEWEYEYEDEDENYEYEEVELDNKNIAQGNLERQVCFVYIYLVYLYELKDKIKDLGKYKYFAHTAASTQ